MTRPGTVLTMLLILYLVALALLIYEEIEGYKWLGRPDPFFDLRPENWIVLTSVTAVVAGWIATSLVAIHNSIKQHTVNTLLQSRLSAAFQDRAKAVDKDYPSLPVLKKLTAADVTQYPNVNKEGIDAIRYFLNYYEFIAVAIRAGDMDELMLKRTVRGIVCTLCQTALPLIKHLRMEDAQGNVGAPQVYGNLLWLYARWRSRSDPVIR